MIPDEAVEAAADIVYRTSGRKRVMSYEQARPTCIDEARQILEAAAPYMLSHERQLTADAHRDAIVNRDTADRLETTLARVEELADQWQEDFPYKANQLRQAIANPYRSQT